MPSDVRQEVYQNPLNAAAVEGAIRILKKQAVDALDHELAKLVQQVEEHYTREAKGEE